MYNIAFNAHSGLRYLVLLLATLCTLYAVIGLFRKQPVDKTGLVLMRVFTSVIDVQFLLGVVTLISGRFFGALIGHIVMMIAAVAVAHIGAVRLKKAPLERRGYGLMLAASLIPLALMIAGILAIQRALI
jgi:hypothetical protein